METTLSLERYAELRAEMDSARLRDEVLIQAGLTTEEWISIQREWLERMSKELVQNRFELTNRYTQAFMARRKLIAKVFSDAAQPRPALSAAEQVLVTPAPIAPIAESVQQPSQVLPAADDMPSSRQMPMSPAALRLSTAEQTLSFDPQLLSAELPFATAAQNLSPSAYALALPVSAALPKLPSSLEAGSTMDISELLRHNPALPFAPPPRPDAPVPSVPGPKGAAVDTQNSTPIAAPVQSSLPFTPSPPHRPEFAAAAAPRQRSLTSMFEALPSVPVIPSLTLEQHASLCAELAFAPARAAYILERYHISAAVKAELDQQWQARFKGEPAIEQKWHDAYQTYFSFLMSTCATSDERKR